MLRGDLDAAHASFTKARETASESALPHLGLAEIALRRENHQEALSHTREALRLGADEPETALAAARLMVRTGPPDEALQALASASKVVPDHPQPHLLSALLLREQERVDEALVAFERALERGVDAPGQVRLEAAGMLLDAERPEAALQQLEEARVLLPETPEVYYRLGAAHRALGDRDAAGEALTRFRELETRRAEAEQDAREIGMALNEAQELASKNRLEEALARVDALLESYPPTTRVLVLRGKVLFSLGRGEEAVAAIVQARDLDPNRVEPHYLEGFFLARVDPQRARGALRKALALAPESAEIRGLLQQLEAAPRAAEPNRP